MTTVSCCFARANFDISGAKNIVNLFPPFAAFQKVLLPPTLDLSRIDQDKPA